MSKFILKQRDCAWGGSPNPFRPRGQMIYGAWKRLGQYESLPEALDALRDRSNGLVDRAVFYKGRRVTDENQRVRTRELNYSTTGGAT